MASGRDRTIIPQPVQRIEPYSKQRDFNIWLKKFEMIIMRMAKIEDTARVDILMTNLDLIIFETVVIAFPDDLKYSSG